MIVIVEQFSHTIRCNMKFPNIFKTPLGLVTIKAFTNRANIHCILMTNSPRIVVQNLCRRQLQRISQIEKAEAKVNSARMSICLFVKYTVFWNIEISRKYSHFLLIVFSYRTWDCDSIVSLTEYILLPYRRPVAKLIQSKTRKTA